jgi:hypothetical protein
MSLSPATRALARVPRIPLVYDPRNHRESALKLVFAVCPEWESTTGEINIYQFIGGLMNSVSIVATFPLLCWLCRS